MEERQRESGSERERTSRTIAQFMWHLFAHRSSPTTVRSYLCCNTPTLAHTLTHTCIAHVAVPAEWVGVKKSNCEIEANAMQVRHSLQFILSPCHAPPPTPWPTHMLDK